MHILTSKKETTNLMHFILFCCVYLVGYGFKSLKTYGSGLFSMRIKISSRDFAAVITTLYVKNLFLLNISLFALLILLKYGCIHDIIKY